MTLYEGPPLALNIDTNMAESDADSGARQEARDAADKVYNDAMSKIAAATDDTTGAVVSTIRKETGLQAEGEDWARNGAQGLLDKIFGLGDDPYQPASVSISAAEMMNPPPVQQYRCWSDPRVLDYTHKATITGRDDRGDVGHITLLFSVKPA